MTEYLYNAIRATSGDALEVCAKITDDYGSLIENGCYMTIYDKDGSTVIALQDGIFDNGIMKFNFDAVLIGNLKGCYWYTINYDGGAISFKQPIYFI